MLKIANVVKHKGCTAEQANAIPRYWLGITPRECDACGGEIGEMFNDARMSCGLWGNVCNSCHRREGKGYGVGRGQQYTRQLDGRWMKTKG